MAGAWIGEKVLGALADKLINGLMDALSGGSDDQATMIVETILKEMHAANQHLENSFNLAIDRARYKDAVTHIQTWIEQFNDGLMRITKNPSDDKKLKKLEESLDDSTNGVHFHINVINSILVDTDKIGPSMIKSFSNRLEEDLCKEDNWDEDKSIKWYLANMEDFLVSQFPIQRAAWTLRMYLVRNDKQDLEACRKKMDTMFAAQVQHAYSCFHPIIQIFKPSFTTPVSKNFWFGIKEANSERFIWNNDGKVKLGGGGLEYEFKCQWRLQGTIEQNDRLWLMNRAVDDAYLTVRETSAPSGMFGSIGYGSSEFLVSQHAVAFQLDSIVPWKVIPVKGKAEFKLKTTKKFFYASMDPSMRDILNSSFVPTLFVSIS